MCHVEVNCKDKGKDPFRLWMTMGLNLETSPPKRMSGKGVLGKTNNRICILASPVYATDVIKEKIKCRYSLTSTTLQLIPKAECTEATLKNTTHGSVRESESLPHDCEPAALSTEFISHKF